MGYYCRDCGAYQGRGDCPDCGVTPTLPPDEWAELGIEGRKAARAKGIRRGTRYGLDDGAEDERADAEIRRQNGRTA